MHMHKVVLVLIATSTLAGTRCGGPVTPTSAALASTTAPPPTTFTLTGRVTAAATGGPLRGAQVSVTSNGRAHFQGTDASGAYSLSGLLGSVTVSVALDGFTAQSRDVMVTDDSVADFALQVVLPPGADLRGAWTATFSVSPQCRDNLPANLRDLTYGATITEQSAQILLTLMGPTIYDHGKPTGSFTVAGTLTGQAVALTIVGDTGYDGWSSTFLDDHFGPNQFVGIDGVVTGTASTSDIHLAMSGDFVYWVVPRDLPTAYCRATDHTLTLRKR